MKDNELDKKFYQENNQLMSKFLILKVKKH